MEVEPKKVLAYIGDGVWTLKGVSLWAVQK